MNTLNNVSIEDARRIRKEILAVVTEIGKADDEEFESYKIIETIGCYCLWLIKSDTAIVTVRDLIERIEEKKSNQFMLMKFDDFTDLFLVYNGKTIDESDPWAHIIEKDEEWSKFKGLADKYTKEELAAAVYKTEYIEEELYEEFFTTVPYGIGELVDRILGINKGDSVVEMGVSSYALEALKRNPEIHIEIYDEDDYVILTLVSILADVMGYSDVICTNSIEENAKFDKVFVNNNLEPSEKLSYSDVNCYLEDEWEEFPREISYNWNMCGIGLLRMVENGKAVAIMNAGELTLNKYREVREFLCEGGFIEGVILLPDKTYSSTWINPYMLIMGRNNKTVRFLDARNEYVAGRVKGKRVNELNDEAIAEIVKKYEASESCIEVSVDEMEKCDYVLTPNRYIKVNNTDANLVSFGNIVKEIKRGVTLSASDMDVMITDKTSDIRCLLPADIAAGVVTSERFFNGTIKKPGKNEAHQGDILISKTGNPFRIAVADKNYLVVGNTYILDIDSTKYSAEYIKCYLSSEAGQREIMKYASGSATPIISVSNLSNIEIPIHDEETQKEMNEHAKEIVSALKESYKQIQICKDEMNAFFR